MHLAVPMLIWGQGICSGLGEQGGLLSLIFGNYFLKDHYSQVDTSLLER